MLYNDDIAELDENVYVELVNPTGGARLGTTSDGTDFNVWSLDLWTLVTSTENVLCLCVHVDRVHCPNSTE